MANQSKNLARLKALLAKVTNEVSAIMKDIAGLHDLVDEIERDTCYNEYEGVAMTTITLEQVALILSLVRQAQEMNAPRIIWEENEKDEEGPFIMLQEIEAGYCLDAPEFIPAGSCYRDEWKNHYPDMQECKWAAQRAIERERPNPWKNVTAFTSLAFCL